MSHPVINCLITSSQYIGEELEAEFGLIPPSFLPIGHECLYVEQARLIRSWGIKNIYLSIPLGFDCTSFHLNQFKDLGIDVIYLSNDLSLGESVFSAVNAIKEQGSLLIMHGDTLFSGSITTLESFVSADIAPPHYRWGSLQLTSHDTNSLVLTGLFYFKDRYELLNALIENKYNFVNSIRFLLNGRLTYKKINGWLDFGHLQTFFHSKNIVKINRNFNNLTFEKYKVIKSSKSKKIISEAYWYENIPYYLRLYTSTYLGRVGTNSYELANEALPTLHDLYIFSRLDTQTWQLIAESISNYLRVAYSGKELSIQNLDILEGNYLEFLIIKTENRLKEWSVQDDVDLSHEWIINGKCLPSLNAIIEFCKNEIRQTNINFKHGVMHGDLCFTNIFYDSRSQLIRMIDPRGNIIDGEDSIYGFLQYDLAKINHSLHGYDEILAGRFSFQAATKYDVDFSFHFDQYRSDAKEIFSKMSVYGEKINSPCIKLLTIMLFIGMTPLHSDNKKRQKAFIANAILLFDDYVRKK